MTVWTCRPEVPLEARAATRTLLQCIGEEIFVEKEDYIDMATAISGTGPAYYLMIMESMIDAGVHMGLSRDMAHKMVLATMTGTVALANRTGTHPVQLRNDITSPGLCSAD